MPAHSMKRRNLKQDSFVEWTAKAAEFIQQYYVHLGIGILVIAVAVIGFSLSKKSQVSAQESASFLLYQGQSLMARGSFESARAPFQECIERFSGTRSGKQARLELAHAFLATGDNEAALATLEDGLRQVEGNDPLNRKLWTSKAATLMNLAQYREAEEIYRRLLAQNPNELEMGEWTMRLADCLQLQGRAGEAMSLLEELQAELESGKISKAPRDLESRLQVLRALAQ